MKKDEGYLGEHRLYFRGETSIPLKRIQKNMILRMNYHNEWKYLYVLNPEWQDKMHAIDLKDIKRKGLLEVIEFINETTEKGLYQEHIYQQPKHGYYAYKTYWRTQIGEIFNIKYELPDD